MQTETTFPSDEGSTVLSDDGSVYSSCGDGSVLLRCFITDSAVDA